MQRQHGSYSKLFSTASSQLHEQHSIRHTSDVEVYKTVNKYIIAKNTTNIKRNDKVCKLQIAQNTDFCVFLWI